MKKTYKVIFSILIGAMILLGTNSVYAESYQSNNGEKAYKGSHEAWMPAIRTMEGVGNVMGLEEEYDSSTLMSTTNSNNIDVHMAKNTEWGAMALLSASQDYGKKGTGSERYVYKDGTNDVNKHTTTGNAYGIYITGYRNWTAAGQKGSLSNKNIDTRYVNYYNSASSQSKIEKKDGDALLQWHEKTYCDGIVNSNGYAYYRGRNGIFSYESYFYIGYGVSGAARAAIVNGQGF